MPINRTYSFDIDTKKYLNRVNTYRGFNNRSNIAMADAVDIDNFVVGLKDLGVWMNSLFWPMRSQHNVGTGSTVLSLGGLGIKNGTISNTSTMTWSTSGLTKSAGVDANILVTGFNLVEGDMSLFGDMFIITPVVFNFVHPIIVSASRSWGIGRSLLGYYPTSLSNSGVFTGNFSLAGGNGKREITGGGTNSLLTRNWSSGSTRYNLSTFNVLFNSAFTEGTPTSTGTFPYINNISDIYLNNSQTASYAYVCGIAGLANYYLNSSQHNSIRSLYKSTIGKGLGLP